MVYWIENNEQFNNHVFFSAPINVSKILNKNLFENVKSVILTSATLNSNDEFNHLKQTTGLNVDHAKSFGSPFDYDNSVEILLPTMFPEPNANNYQEELDKIIFENVLSSNGRAMVLFTSYKSLRNTQKSLKTKLEEYNINVLAQGVDGNPYQIIKRFKKNPKSLILGTLSFWEGVDIEDGSLDLLIITKLPFDVPTHPLFEARSAKYDNSFIEYALPRAILKFKQGFGRLIRNEKDTGKVLLLDSRITSKRYGKMFLEALPGGKKIFLEPDFS
jgi:DNA polymerase-3 subunit epsilon/ATP-dependent DNA helicase DinG